MEPKLLKEFVNETAGNLAYLCIAEITSGVAFVSLKG